MEPQRIDVEKLFRENVHPFKTDAAWLVLSVVENSRGLQDELEPPESAVQEAEEVGGDNTPSPVEFNDSYIRRIKIVVGDSPGEVNSLNGLQVDQ